MSAQPHRPVIALNWPVPAEKVVSFVSNVVQLCTGNKWLTSSTALVTAVAAALATVVAAMPAAKQRAPGAVEGAGTAISKLKTAVEKLADAVQTAADDNPDESLAIIEGCGFQVKTVTLPKKSTAKATAQTTLGTVLLNVLAIAGAITYYWQVSTDNKTWSDTLPTGGSKTTVTGLASDTTYYFRFRVLLKGGYTNWSESFHVHVP